jgi:hypothetical protein
VRTKKFEKFTKLLVEWEDILSESEWHDKDKLDKTGPMPVKTLGFYLDTRKRTLRVAHSICEDGDCDVTCIPWGCITKIRELDYVG